MGRRLIRQDTQAGAPSGTLINKGMISSAIMTTMVLNGSFSFEEKSAVIAANMTQPASILIK